MPKKLAPAPGSQDPANASDPGGQKITAAERDARRREVVRLRYSGMPQRQIATLLGVAVSTVNNDEQAYTKAQSKRPDFEARRFGILGRMRHLYELTLGEASNYLAAECGITDDEIAERPALGPLRSKARAERAAFRVEAYQKARGFLVDEARIAGQLAIPPPGGVGSDPNGDDAEQIPHGTRMGPAGDEIDAVEAVVRALPLDEQQEFNDAVRRANELFARGRALQPRVPGRVRVEADAEVVPPEMAESD